MLKNIISFYDQSRAIVEATQNTEHKITWADIRESLSDCMFKLSSMKFKDPVEGREKILKDFDELAEEMTAGFRSLED